MAREHTFIIAVDGIDYSGKSTLTAMLRQTLATLPKIDKVEGCFFPSQGHYGKLARERIAVNSRDPKELKKTAGYLVSDFINTPINTIYKNRDGGVLGLVYDRYVVTCLASQGDPAYNVVMTAVDEMEETKPDLYILLTTDYETALQRRGDSEKWDSALEDSFMASKEKFDAWQKRYKDLHTAACRRMRITQPLTIDTSKGIEHIYPLLLSMIEPVVDAKFYTEDLEPTN